MGHCVVPTFEIEVFPVYNLGLFYETLMACAITVYNPEAIPVVSIDIII
jgi:hypothetical protein